MQFKDQQFGNAMASGPYVWSSKPWCLKKAVVSSVWWG
jgi:hypothetical protein